MRLPRQPLRPLRHHLWYASALWNPSAYGDYGVTAGDFALPGRRPILIVTAIVPGSSAQKSGIKVGDRIGSALPVHDRLTLTSQIAPRPGEQVTARASAWLERTPGQAQSECAQPAAAGRSYLSRDRSAGGDHLRGHWPALGPRAPEPNDLGFLFAGTAPHRGHFAALVALCCFVSPNELAVSYLAS